MLRVQYKRETAERATLTQRTRFAALAKSARIGLDPTAADGL